MMNKKVQSGTIILCAAIIIMGSVFVFKNSNLEETLRTENLNDYTPLAIIGEKVLYDYLTDDGTFVIGYYDIASQNARDFYTEKDFYISSGVSVEINDIVYLPITLANGMHELLEISVEKNSVISVNDERNSYPIDTIATMNGDVYMLSMNVSENETEETIIKRYSGGNDFAEMLKKEIKQGRGEIIKAFSCCENRIYVLVEYLKDDGVGCRIDVYDEKMILKETINLVKSMETEICSKGVAFFCCAGNYIYLRDFTDEGYIGEIKGDVVEEKLRQPGLRIVNNNGCRTSEYQIFFVRSTADLYVLSLSKGELVSKTLPLQENESIRSAVENDKTMCISILDERDEEYFTTKYTLLMDVEKDIIEDMD